MDATEHQEDATRAQASTPRHAATEAVMKDERRGTKRPSVNDEMSDDRLGKYITVDDSVTGKHDDGSANATAGSASTKHTHEHLGNAPPSVRAALLGKGGADADMDPSEDTGMDNLERLAMLRDGGHDHGKNGEAFRELASEAGQRHEDMQLRWNRYY